MNTATPETPPEQGAHAKEDCEAASVRSDIVYDKESTVRGRFGDEERITVPGATRTCKSFLEPPWFT